MMDAKYWDDLAVGCLREAAASEGKKAKTWLSWAVNAMKKSIELRPEAEQAKE